MLDKILERGILGLVFFLPFFFLPLTTEFYDFNKFIFLSFYLLILMVVWAFRAFQKQEIYLTRSPLDLPVILILLVYALAHFLVSTNKVEAFIMPGGTGMILALTVLYFLVKETSLSKGISLALVGSASLLSFVAIYQFIGVGETLIPEKSFFEFMRTTTWTPAGNPLSLAIFLVLVLSFYLPQFWQEWEKKPPLEYFALLLILCGLGVTSYELLTSAKPLFLPFSAGWFVAVEALKRFPFLGVGLDNYLAAFTAGRPIFLNSTNLWNIRFGLSSNHYFYILTTTGLLGLFAWFFLILRTVRLTKNKYLVFLPLFVSFLLFFLTPAVFLLFFVLYLFLGLLANQTVMTEVKFASKTATQILLTVIILLAAVGFYGLGRFWLADYSFRQSLSALAQNRGTDAYNLQIKAINLNPQSETYRLTYSQTNLALANALSTNAKAGGLTDQDRQNISGLVQQAIQEAKVAVNLGPNRVNNWENLTNIYQSLINAAQGADQWTLAAYNQTIALDPTNPLLRLNLGSLFFSAKNYDEAIRQFNLSISLKPDFANAYYNLAAALKETGKIKEAVAAMERVLGLVEPNSNDYRKAKKELEDLRAILPKEETKEEPSGQPETLTEPATSSAVLKPPLKLPENAAPPISTSSGEKKEKEKSPSPSAS